MIITAHKRPALIQVIRASDLELYREQFGIKTNELGHMWCQGQKCYNPLNEGDFIRVDDPHDMYPIGGEYFEKNFIVHTDNPIYER